MVLHATASFLAQAIATLRLHPDRAQVTQALGEELKRLEEGVGELRAHLAAHAAEPHRFVAALFAEVSLFKEAVRGS
jgi:hypothetical protein